MFGYVFDSTTYGTRLVLSTSVWCRTVSTILANYNQGRLKSLVSTSQFLLKIFKGMVPRREIWQLRRFMKKSALRFKKSNWFSHFLNLEKIRNVVFEIVTNVWPICDPSVTNLRPICNACRDLSITHVRPTGNNVWPICNQTCDPYVIHLQPMCDSRLDPSESIWDSHVTRL